MQVGDSLPTLLHGAAIPWRAFIGMSELLREPIEVLHTGEAGGWHQLGFGQVALRGVSLCLNGRPWQELTFGVISPELYPPEYVGRIELLKGTEAVVLAWDALGVALNIVEPTWYTGRLYSRLWYLNAAYGVGGSDGTLVVVPHPAWEFVGGYRRVSSEGRFLNGWSNGWNARLRLQWVPAPQVSLTLSELFTHWVLGLNGGVDWRRSPQWWDPLTAQPVLPQLNDRLYRHDVTLTALWVPDSQHALSAQLWYVPALWERHIGGAAGGSITDLRWTAWQLGIRLHGELRRVNTAFLGGVAGMLGYSPQLPFARRLEQQRVAGYILGRWEVGEVGIRAGARLMVERGAIRVAGGIGLQGHWGTTWWQLDLSRGVRSHSAVERGGYGEIVQLLGEIGRKERVWGWEMGVAAQRLSDAVIARDTSPPSHQTHRGVYFWGSLRHWLLGVDLELSVSALPFAESPWRTVHVVLTAHTERRFGGSLLRAGLRWEVIRAPALGLSPVLWTLYLVEQTPGVQHSGGEIYLAARMGMAYLRLSLRNLLDAPWYRIPYYPQPGRSLVFELTWAFLE